MHSVPRHIAIILDGNRRYARRLGKNELTGHTAGLRNLLRIAKAAQKHGIERMTVYALSIQNLQRSRAELRHLFGLLRTAATKLGESSEAREGRLRVEIAGDLSVLPADMRTVAQDVARKTKGNHGFSITLAIGYGGREEIVAASRALARDVSAGRMRLRDVDEGSFAARLWAQGEPDLVIRTGGDVRTSNFLPWQTIYSEWFFEKKTWPEFTEADLVRVLREFNRRARRFGK